MEYLCSVNNQHVGVQLKADAIIMMDVFCYCSPSEFLLEKRSKARTVSDGIKPSHRLLFMKRYQVCFGVLSQKSAISFPCCYLQECPPLLAAFPLRWDGCVSHTRYAVQSKQGHCRNHSLPGNPEVALTSERRDWVLWVWAINQGEKDALTTDREETLI